MLQDSSVIYTLYSKATYQITFDSLPHMPTSDNPEGSECGRLGVKGENTGHQHLLLCTQSFPTYVRNRRFSQHFICCLHIGLLPIWPYPKF